jgi:ATP/maltotriose-dependent transcriptional regulator MalT
MLKTRLPRSPQRVVRRRRLLESVRRVAGDPVGEPGIVLVTGSAGSGKTTLMSEWLSSEGVRWGIATVWVTVDRTDGVVDLWTAVLSAAAASEAWGRRGRPHDLHTRRSTR